MEGEREAKASSSSSSQREEEEEEEQSNAINDYEQQRLARIRENKARLEALGIPVLASSLLGSSSSKKLGQDRRKQGKKKQKKNNGDDDYDDDEYRPSDEDEEEEEGDEDVGPSSSSSSRQQKAIALSLGGTAEGLAVGSDAISPSSVRAGPGASVRVEKDEACVQQNAGRRKSGKMNKSRVQLTEDEVVAYFFSFDEAGTGHISLRDLQRMVLAHDFSWTQMEIASMIHSFDSDQDGKLNLEDFRNIVYRCNMMQARGTKETGNG